MEGFHRAGRNRERADLSVQYLVVWRFPTRSHTRSISASSPWLRFNSPALFGRCLELSFLVSLTGEAGSVHQALKDLDQLTALESPAIEEVESEDRR
jgi:hypothetical protein